MSADLSDGDPGTGGLEQALNKLALAERPSTDETVRAARQLAEASRTNFAIRKGLGNSKPLQQLVALIDCSLHDSLETVDVALRCIGNACIDNDVARQNITRLGFSWATRCLNSSELDEGITARLTAKVLYNICLDFEPAQQQCFRDHLHYPVINTLFDSFTSSLDDVPLIAELLFRICSRRETEGQEARPMPAATLVHLLSLPTIQVESLTAEEHAMLTDVCLLYLRTPETQDAVIEQELIGLVWQILLSNEKQIGRAALNEEDQQLLLPLSQSVVWVLSDIAANPAMAQHHHPMQSDWMIRYVFPTISATYTEADDRIRSAACQVLGNVLWSFPDPASLADLVTAQHLHVPIIASMVTAANLDVLHSAAGLLVQLSRLGPDALRTITADPQTVAAVERLCQHNNLQLKQDGIKLLRALGRDNPAFQTQVTALARNVVESTAVAGAEVDTNMTELPD